MGFVYNSKENFLRAIKKNRVICFGAGFLLEQLLQKEEEWNKKIEYVLDNDPAKQDMYVPIGDKDIPIKHPNILKHSLNQFVVLITCRALMEIKVQLLDLGVMEEQIFSIPFSREYPEDKQERRQLRMVAPCHEMLYRYFQIFNFNIDQRKTYSELIDNKLRQDGMVAPYMTVLVTSKCTLKCKDCCNLMPYCDYSRNLPKETIINDIDKISKNIDYCVCMNITGGEPLLHENIDEIIAAITEKENILFVEIITNGTIVPSRKVLKSLKSDKLVVRISKYTKYSKIDQLAKIFSDEGIHFIVKEDFQWNSPGGIVRRNKERDRIKYEYLECWAGKYCKSIWDGNLYACARTAYLHEFSLSRHPSDFIEITDEKLREHLLDFYLADYVDACDFCDMESADGIIVEPAIQINSKVLKSGM